MTNYVTGYLPTVPPKDWMKIAVGGVLGAVQLKDLKDYVGQANNGNTTTIKLSDVTIPSDSVIYKDAPTSSNIQLNFSPLGANEDVWTFSPDTATVSASDFAKTGVQTWARDNSGSGEVISWSQLDGSSMSNFTINANQTSSGQQTIILKDSSTVSSGNVLVFHAIGGGTEKTFTVTIS